jgi:hypothetical protein
MVSSSLLVLDKGSITRITPMPQWVYFLLQSFHSYNNYAKNKSRNEKTCANKMSQ